MTSQRGLKTLESIGERYYLKCEDDAFDAQNIWASLTDWLNSISGLVFVAAIILTTAFVSINLERATKMSEEKKLSLQGGASVPTMQKITKDAAPAPTMQNIARPDGLEKAAQYRRCKESLGNRHNNSRLPSHKRHNRHQRRT